MEEATLEIFESYFKNNNWRFSIVELSSHYCSFCENERKNQIIYHSKQDMAKFIIMYLNHLKLYGASWKKVNYFIKSVKLSNFCNENVTGKWLMDYWHKKNIYILLHF